MKLTRSQVRAFLEIQHAQAVAGLQAETHGIPKYGQVEALEKSVRDALVGARLSACHREELAVLFLDVRGSSKLAATHRREDMFLAFHCLLPMSALILRASGGAVVGLRGDGVLGVVGLDEQDLSVIVRDAFDLGMMLIEGTTEVLNPFLRKKGVPIAFAVGVGLDVGEVTLTKIGFQSDFEVTAYGEAVNTAAKNSRGINQLWMSGRARLLRDGVAEGAFFSRKMQRLVDTL